MVWRYGSEGVHFQCHISRYEAPILPLRAAVFLKLIYRPFWKYFEQQRCHHGKTRLAWPPWYGWTVSRRHCTGNSGSSLPIKSIVHLIQDFGITKSIKFYFNQRIWVATRSGISSENVDIEVFARSSAKKCNFGGGIVCSRKFNGSASMKGNQLRCCIPWNLEQVLTL